MRKSLLNLALWSTAIIGAAGFCYYSLRQEKTFNLDNAPLSSSTIEERVNKENIQEPEKVDPTGHISLTGSKGLTFLSRFGSVETYNARYFIGPGTDQLSPNLSREDFETAIMYIPKELQIIPLLEIGEFKFNLGNRIARARNEPNEIRGYDRNGIMENNIMARDIRRNFKLIAEQIIEEGLVLGYSTSDIEYIDDVLSMPRALRDRYSVGDLIRFTYTPGVPPEKGVLTISDHRIVPSEESQGSFTKQIEGLEERVYEDSSSGSFNGWFNGRLIHRFTEEDRCKDASLGESHTDWGFKNYKDQYSQLATARE